MKTELEILEEALVFLKEYAEEIGMRPNVVDDRVTELEGLINKKKASRKKLREYFNWTLPKRAT